MFPSIAPKAHKTTQSLSPAAARKLSIAQQRGVGITKEEHEYDQDTEHPTVVCIDSSFSQGVANRKMRNRENSENCARNSPKYTMKS